MPMSRLGSTHTVKPKMSAERKAGVGAMASYIWAQKSAMAAVRARREVFGGCDGQGPEPGANDLGPSEQLEQLEQQQRIRAAVAELPERQREAIALYAFERMKYCEIADLMEMPVGTVRTLIHRARASLAQRLKFNRD